MSYRTNADNVFKEGTVITANADPGVKLLIRKYYQRIYYCYVIGDDARKQLAYFERELIPPAELG